MAAASTDITTAVSDDVGVPRRRGKSKAPNFKYAGSVSVIRLELDICDKRMRRSLERHWQAVFRLRRALQRDAADRCRAYWAAHHERRAARVDYALAHALRASLASQQEWEGSVNRHQPPTPPDGVGSARTGSHHLVASAEQASTRPTPEQTMPNAWTSRDQPKGTAPKQFGAA